MTEYLEIWAYLNSTYSVDSVEPGYLKPIAATGEGQADSFLRLLLWLTCAIPRALSARCLLYSKLFLNGYTRDYVPWERSITF